ncbi:hypothetical protein DAEQUDRAFT_768909 [Daedalea quercina L-15889]|uniref:Uncharacterized protein n=1 Tax=Daedalea quercina L-15889 TaxID=1314783 RepID=A0A165M7Z9_9APHY|nr:hypothetical protein DAEQUDRAFT_768909 [Daedalea quercina L-15889]
MRFSGVLAVIALSAAASPVMSRPVFARDYDDLLVREPLAYEELDARGIFGFITHGISAAAHGIAHLVHKHKQNKAKNKKRDLDELEPFERDLDGLELFERDLAELDLFERALPESDLLEREYYDYGYY